MAIIRKITNKRNMAKTNYSERYLSLNFILILIFLVMISSFVSAASESYKPYLHKPSIGGNTQNF